MLLTPKLSLKKPEASDSVDIDDINDNMDTLDAAVSGKVTSAGGDISSTVITTLDTITTQFPVPTGGEAGKTFFGKVRKFIQDFNTFKTGILTVGQLVNNAATNNASLPVSAAVTYLLQNQITQINGDLTKFAKILWSGKVSAAETVINLSDSVENYSIIGIEVVGWDSGAIQMFSASVNTYVVRSFNLTDALTTTNIDLLECFIFKLSGTQLRTGNNTSGGTIKWQWENKNGANVWTTKSAEELAASDFYISKVIGIV